MVSIDSERKLNFNDFRQILEENKSIEFTENALKKVEDNYHFLLKYAENKIIYGINTGLGPMAQYKIDDNKRAELQFNLIRSHAAGIGNPIDDASVLAALVVRVNCFCAGYSGVHPDTIEKIKFLINNRIIPYIPEHGSVGASGDLVQLAHLALVLIGEGKAKYKGEWQNSADIFKSLNITPFEPRIREGLALINGTSIMTGIGIVNVMHAINLLNWSMLASVIINEIVSTFDDHCSPELNDLKLHYGQQQVAHAMYAIFERSSLTSSRRDTLYSNKENGSFMIEKKVQEYYSLRCVPQILGPVYDTIKNAALVVINEANSVSDNPVIDMDSNFVYHGGNFHGDYVSFEMDKLKIAITKLSMLAERQLNYVLNHRLNKILPPFVNMGTLGLNLGYQATQFTAVSTTAENQTLSNPMYIHSIPNNNDNQDIVSMGTNSALIARKVIENTYQVLSIELMSLMQAIDYMNIVPKLSSETQKIYNEIRAIIPIYKDDYAVYTDIQKVNDYLTQTHKHILKVV
jgi:histidine ammonia-lyase